jgi:hypothetical protein
MADKQPQVGDPQAATDVYRGDSVTSEPQRSPRAAHVLALLTAGCQFSSGGLPV